ncbi:helix-turn-helix transcriptional regulator [Natronosalvus vescus]|uniref:helix-turn-helix transcriptional regulator n=1 Tax=Natronosalvus vescus TaxID=2953881 RepID=UPI0020904F22|nr:MarR family transcriptional regulator [Natronosalvus vescus]
MDDVLAEIEYLSRSPHRAPMLTALAEQPRDRRDLQSVTGASASTVSRTLRAFEKRRWIARNGHRYETTQLGSFVAVGLQALIDRFETERTLREIWDWLPDDVAALPLEGIAEATVTMATVDDPYRPVTRFRTLLEETETFRFVGFELALLEPCKDELCQRIIDGVEAVIIDPPSVVRYIRSTYPDLSTRTLDSGNLTVLVLDEQPPFGLCLFDGCVSVTIYSPETGAVRALIDTDESGVREWAESTFDEYRAAAKPMSVEA